MTSLPTDGPTCTLANKSFSQALKALLTLLLTFSFFLFPLSLSYAHSGKPKYHVIIDTDGALDDLRAITMLLACNDVRVLGIIGSQGTLSADSSCAKVRQLLGHFHHEGIPVGKGRATGYPLPFWSEYAGSVPWSDDTPRQEGDLPDALELLNDITCDYPQKLTLIALGALTNLSDWLKEHPENQAKIERIIWYGKPGLTSEFNYQADPDSYRIIESLPVKLEIVSNDRKNLMWDEEMISELDSSQSAYAAHLAAYFKMMSSRQRAKSADFELYDDLIPLFLMVPIVFTEINSEDPVVFALERNLPDRQVASLITTLLDSSLKANNRMFTDFPVDTLLYQRNVAAILPSTLGEYGLTEWKSVVLTNEIHGHTGIYSIIGVKMGVRALEYFNVGVNNLETVTIAGNVPPLSCLNDGIQVSTGSTIGQGLIRIDPDGKHVPAAVFSFNGQVIRIDLKKDIAERIEADIRRSLEQFGMTDRYWSRIEQLAFQYWQEMDRHQIFTLEKIDQTGADKSEFDLTDIKHEMKQAWPGNRAINLVFHGHSVPAGYFKTPDVRTLEAYPYQVLRELKKLYPLAVINVIVTAIGGENSEQGAIRFSQDVLIHKPDVLFIDYALNDRGIGADRSRQAWESMIRQARERGIRIVLLTPSPDQNVDILDPATDLQKLSDQIAGLAQRYGTGLVDSYALFRDKVKAGEPVGNYMSQVNHPNEKGHHLIAESIISLFK